MTLAGTLAAGCLGQTLPASDDGFGNDPLRQTLPEVHVSFLFQSARALARRALDSAAKVVPREAAKADRGCVTALLDAFGARAFRRPLASSETEGYLALFEKEAATSGSENGLRQLVTVLLMSPHFLFRTSSGTGPWARWALSSAPPGCRT